MTNKMINSAQAPAAVGPYSHSVLAGNTLYISGQLGLDPQSGEIEDYSGRTSKTSFYQFRFDFKRGRDDL